MSGRVRAVIFDLAGTLVDVGCHHPVTAMRAVFRRRGIRVSARDVRAHMGLAKPEHLAQLGSLPAVRARLDPTDADPRAWAGELDELLRAQMRQDPHLLVPGAKRALVSLREQGVAVGVTSGYSKAVLEDILPQLWPHVGAWSASDQVPRGRPAPHLLWRTMMELGVTDPRDVVVVDDTAPGLRAARLAGARSAAVTLTSSDLGLTRTALVDGLHGGRFEAGHQRQVRALGDVADVALRTVVDVPRWVGTQRACSP